MNTLRFTTMLALAVMLLIPYADAEKLIWMREAEEEEVRGQLYSLQMRKKFLENEVDRLEKSVDVLEKENFRLKMRNNALESQLSVLTRSSMRIWTSKNGKKLMAKLGEVDEKFVELKKKDDTTVLLKRKQLSEEDNNYLDILMGKGDFAAPAMDEADPFDTIVSDERRFGTDE